MVNKQFAIFLLVMLIIPISIFAESPFPETVIQSKYSTSPYATTENLFSPQNPYGVGQELNGQCTWYVYGRVIELVDNNYIVESVENAMYNAFNQTYGRHAKFWDTLLEPSTNWHSTTYNVLPYEERKAGKIVMWDYGNYGHVAFVEEVNSDRSQYKVSEFNWAISEGYTPAVWLPFEGDDQRGTGVYPKFYDLELRPDGYAPVSNGLTISSDPVTLDQDFYISFTLHEINGASITFEEIAIAILDADDNYIFDFENWYNVTVSANGYYSESATNQIWYDNGNNPPGQYKAVLRGKVSGGNWFQFDTTGSGENPVTFTAIMDQDIVVNSLNPPEGTVELNENESQLFAIDAYDPDGNTLEYSWLLDGTEVSTSDSYNFTTDYNSAGNYDLELNVTDNFRTRSDLNFEWDIVVIDVSSVEDNLIPFETKLDGNFPNPFNPTTTIQYDLNKSGFVQIEIYNVKGQKVKSLVNQNQTAGNKSVIWNGVNENGNRIGSGLFLYKFVFNGNVLSMKKCIMLK
ncbi:MAG: CHAP domain-containing protein [Candidatus Tenebribacter mawsonii]|nr:CHAP domain-containing protein [Candidatus Tenebribacter mawsonii]